MSLLAMLIFGFLVSTPLAVLAVLTKFFTVLAAGLFIIIGSLLVPLTPFELWGLVFLFIISDYVLKQFRLKFYEAEQENSNIQHLTLTIWQVAATGCPLLAAAVLFFYTRDYSWLIVSAAIIAAATADTWATELGIFSATNPRNILTGEELTKGISGGVSKNGLIAGISGSLIVASIFWGFLSIVSVHVYPFRYFWVVFIAGVINLLLDSCLGVFQANYQCTVCGLETENLIHHQLPTKKISGFSLFNNELVDFISITLTALLAWFFAQL